MDAITILKINDLSTATIQCNTISAQNAENLYTVSDVQEKLKDFDELNPDEATLSSAITYINQFLRIFKNTALVIMLLCLPTVNVIAAHQDSPTGVQTNITQKFNSIPGKRLMYDADAVEIRLKDADIKPKTYPLFILSLNTDIPASFKMENDHLVCDGYKLTDYVSIELKATTNNFFKYTIGKDGSKPWNNKQVGFDNEMNTYTVPGRVLFFAASSCTETVGGDKLNPNDNMRVYACDSNCTSISMPNSIYKTPVDFTDSLDVRSWLYYTKPSDLGNPYVRYIAIIVDPEAIKEDGLPYEWCNDKNEELLWSYCRFTVDGNETVDSKMVWTPCQPIKWFNEMPTWALTNNEIRVINKTK